MKFIVRTGWVLALWAVSTVVSHGAVITWTNTVGGNWNTPANWNPNQVPVATDDAIITTDGIYTVTLTAAASVNSLTVGGNNGLQSFNTANNSLNIGTSAVFGALGNLVFNGGSIDGTGTVSMAGSNYWAGGIIDVSGLITITSSGQLQIDTGADHNFPGTIWNNLGVVAHSGGAMRGGSTTFTNIGTWVEEADTTLNVPYAGAVQFLNRGTFRKLAGTGATTFQGNFLLINFGLVDAEAGTILIQDNGGTNNSGTFTAATGATINFNATYTFNGNNTFNGPGAILLTMGGNVATFNGNIITTNLQWQSAYIDGTLTNTMGSVFYITTGADHNYPHCTIDNEGTIIHNGGAVRGGQNGTATPSFIFNRNLWLDESDDVFNNPYGGVDSFLNTGTYRKIGTTGSSIFQGGALLINSSLVDAQTGTILIQDGGGTNNSGTFNAAAGATVNFNSTYTFNGNNTFSGQGVTELTMGGNVATFNGNIITTNLQWQSAYIDGTLTNTMGSVFYITTGADHNYPHCTIDNEGTIIHNGGAVRGGQNGTATPSFIFNRNLWLDESDDVFNNPYGGVDSFLNTGTYRKIGTTGSSIFQGGALLINSSLVDAQTGTILIQDGGGTNNSGTFNAAAGATVNFNSTYTFNGNNTFSGQGVTELTMGGNVATFNGNIITTNLQWQSAYIDGTLTNTMGSVFYITTGADHNYPHCTIDNEGTIIHNGGAVRGGQNGTATPSFIFNRNLWLDESDDVFNNPYGAGDYILNLGTYRKMGSTNTTVFQGGALLINSGLVDAQTGTVLIQDGGGTNNAGTFNAALNATVDFNANYTFNDRSAFTGLGTVELNMGGSTATFNGGIITTNLQWVSAFVGGKLTNNPGSVFYIVSGSDHNLPSLILDNQGTIIHTAGAVRGGGTGVGTPQTLIANHGTWLEQADGVFQDSFGGGEQFVNTGTFRKQASTSTTTFQGNFLLINSGLVDAQTGTIQIADGGGAATGTFNAASAAIVNFTAPYTFNNGATFTGAGANTLNSGAPGINIAGGFNSANLQWVSGRIIGSGTNNVGSTFYITTGNNHDYPGAFLKNLGTIVHNGGDIRGGTSTIDNSGTWQELTDNSFTDPFSASNAVFINNGTFSKTGTTGSTFFQPNTILTNSGVLQILTGAVATQGSFIQNHGTLSFGLTSPAVYGKFSFTGQLPINGTLGLSLLAGYMPALGDSFTPITTIGTETNSFQNLNLTTLPTGDAWQVNYNPNSVNLQVVAFGAASGQIAGSVKDAPTHGVANINVFAFSTNNPSVYVSTTTDANGLYTLNVTNSNWTVGLANLAAAGYNSVADQLATISSGHLSQEVDFVIQVTGATAPAATTTIANAITANSATLNGTVNPDGESVTVYFAYGTIALDHFTTTNTITANLNGAQLQSLPITGLTPATQYQFQLVAENSAGTNFGGIKNFSSLGLAPVVATLAASDIGSTNATVNGSVNPGGVASTYYFEYGPDTNYGSFTATNALIAGNATLSVTNALTNLQPATVYHYQLVGVNGVGTTTGGDLTFTNAPAAPAVTTLAASGVDATEATLNGSVNPNGAVTTYYFEYGTTPGYGSFTATNSLTNALQNVIGAISGLNPNTVYHFQLVAANALGTNGGGDLTFTNSGVAADVITLAAAPVSSTSATLNGTVNPEGASTTVYFEYGTTTLNQTTPSTILTGSTVQAQAQAIIGLIPGTQYQFEIVAVNSSGTNFGGILTFTTPGALPSVTTLTATAIGATNATVNGSINPGGLATVYYFEYGNDTNYGAFTATNALAAGNGLVTVSSLVTNLSPASVYHYQILAVNALGTNGGGDLTFTNTPAAPVAVTLPASPVGITDATLNGTINPNGAVTLYYFEYGTTTNYGFASGTNQLLATNVAVAVSHGIAALMPDTLYHFQLVASNSFGTNLGGDLTFMNSSLPATVACPGDITTNSVAGQCGQTVAFAVVAGGNPTPTVTYTLGGTPITSPFSFPIGTNVVSVTASNVGGMDVCSFNVIVNDSTPPIAGANQLGTTEGSAASVDVAKVLLRDHSQRGNPLSITGVVSPTAALGTVSLDGGSITYTPADGFLGMDAIKYTLSDGCGSVQGTIVVAVLSTNLPAQNLISITITPTGRTVVFAGVPFAPYVVQSAPGPNGPWTDLSDLMEAASNGLIQYTDQTTPIPPARFYRTRTAVRTGS